MGVPLAALSINQQQPSPLHTAAEAMQLKSLAGQQELQQIQIDQAKQDQAAYKAANSQWKPNAQGVYDQNDFLDLLRKNNVSPQTMMKLQSMQLDRTEKMSIAAKNNAEAAASEFTTKSKKAELLAGDISTVQARPDEQQSAALSDVLQKRVADGTLTAQEASQYSAVQPGHLDDIKKHVLGEKGFYDNAKAQADAAKSQSDAQLAQMKVKQQAGLQSGAMDSQIDQIFPPSGKTSSEPNKRFKSQANFFLQRGDLEGAKGVLSQASAEAGKTEEALNPDIQANKIATAEAEGRARANVQLGGFGGASDPMVDLVGQNKVDLATALQRVPPAGKAAFMSQLSAKYPDYNQGTFGVEKGVSRYMTSGEGGKNLTAFNTAIEHANQLKDATDALDNGDMRGLNKIGNALGYQFGSDKMTNFNVIKNALSGEISKVFKGGQATDAEIKEVQGPFNAANSPAQLKGAIANAVKLMNSKRDALKQQYEQGVQGKPNFGTTSSTTEHKPGGQATGLKEGQTGTGSDGKKYIVKGGVWQPQ